MTVSLNPDRVVEEGRVLQCPLGDADAFHVLASQVEEGESIAMVFVQRGIPLAVLVEDDEAYEVYEGHRVHGHMSAVRFYAVKGMHPQAEPDTSPPDELVDALVAIDDTLNVIGKNLKRLADSREPQSKGDLFTTVDDPAMVASVVQMLTHLLKNGKTIEVHLYILDEGNE